MDSSWVLKSIEPKSDQLNADDLQTGPATVTVTGVRKGNAEQPIAIEIDGGRQPYKPCKSMRRVLVMCWGERPAEWVGKSMTLYCDPDVMFAGMRVGGIRISHLSHIDKPMEVALTVTRGKRAIYRIEPLAASNKKQTDVAARVAKAIKAVRDCETIDQLKKCRELMGELIKQCDGDQLLQIESAVDERTEQLKTN